MKQYIAIKTYRKEHIREVINDYCPKTYFTDEEKAKAYEYVIDQFKEYNPWTLLNERPWLLQKSINDGMNLTIRYLPIVSYPHNSKLSPHCAPKDVFKVDNDLWPRVCPDKSGVIWTEPVCNCLSMELFVQNVRFRERMNFKYRTEERIVELFTMDLHPNTEGCSRLYDPWQVVSTPLPKEIWLDIDTAKRNSEGGLLLTEFQQMLRSISTFNQEQLSDFASLLKLTSWEDAICQIKSKAPCQARETL